MSNTTEKRSLIDRMRPLQTLYQTLMSNINRQVQEAVTVNSEDNPAINMTDFEININDLEMQRMQEISRLKMQAMACEGLTTKNHLGNLWYEEHTPEEKKLLKIAKTKKAKISLLDDNPTQRDHSRDAYPMWTGTASSYYTPGRSNLVFGG